MMAKKYWITGILGIGCTMLGIWLRLMARDLAWPSNYGYSGPREETVWAIRERAYQDLSLVILGFGLAVILMVLITWLWLPLVHAHDGQGD
jgi:hypothetical protein